MEWLDFFPWREVKGRKRIPRVEMEVEVRSNVYAY